MWKWIVVVLFSVGLILFMGLPVFAGTSADVTITATGYICAAPGGLILTYVNDNEVGISWTKGVDAANTMVRGAVGRLPTSITDGYQVYYGSGNTTSDTGVSFEETAAPIYYRAWSQNAAGIWEINGIWDYIEGVGMTLIALILFGGIVSFFALWKKSPLIGMAASAVWVFTLMYTRVRPIGGIAIASPTDEFIVAALFAVAIAIPISSCQMERKEKKYYESYKEEDEGRYTKSDAGASMKQNRTIRHGWDREFAETPEEYQTRVHQVLHPKRRR